MLDYALEIEHFDLHLKKMIELLREKGELDNTIIIVTADNGMPFPRAKGLQYDYSTHLPLAVMWPAGIKNPGRTEHDLISIIDIAPTITRAASMQQSPGFEKTTGRPMQDIFENKKQTDRSFIVLGQERHDYGRPLNQGYPVRSVISDGYLYIHNFKPDLWPVGNPETGYLNTDGSPTKSMILNLRRHGADTTYWQLNFGLHPLEELYDLKTDRNCMFNIAQNPDKQVVRKRLKRKLFAELKEQKDPRMSGKGNVFDNYPFAEESSQNFYERYLRGEILNYQTKWVNPTDYER
jgi:N-sulfoglucosamine sulfohydrolase